MIDNDLNRKVRRMFIEHQRKEGISPAGVRWLRRNTVMLADTDDISKLGVIETGCMECGREMLFIVNGETYEKWENREIRKQDAWPDMKLKEAFMLDVAPMCLKCSAPMHGTSFNQMKRHEMVNMTLRELMKKEE